MRTLIIVLLAMWLLSYLHWGQEYDKITVITSAPCAMGAGVEQNQTCTYKDVALSGQPLTKSYVIHAGQASFIVGKDNVITMSWDSKDAHAHLAWWGYGIIALAVAMFGYALVGSISCIGAAWNRLKRKEQR